MAFAVAPTALNGEPDGPKPAATKRGEPSIGAPSAAAYMSRANNGLCACSRGASDDGDIDNRCRLLLARNSTGDGMRLGHAPMRSTALPSELSVARLTPNAHWRVMYHRQSRRM